MATKMKIGILGTCPVCEGEFKVRDGRLVHHGYQRPGDGMIHGDCYAVGYEPYERSTKGCVDFKASIGVSLAAYKARLKELPKRAFFEEVTTNWRREITTKQYAVGVTDFYVMHNLVKDKTRALMRNIATCETEIARMDRLITAWSLKELREVTEEAASAATKALRDARKAERDAKNAAKDAKAAALKAKRDARETKREGAFTAFVGSLQGIKDSERTSEEKKRLALAAWHQFFSPKNKRELGDLTDFVYAFRKRDLDGLLVDVGVARRDGRGYVDYPSWTY